MSDQFLAKPDVATHKNCAGNVLRPGRLLSDLTCLRAVFAAWVFACHLNLQLGAPATLAGAVCRRGYLGVDGFFILSGFVLAHAHDAPRLDRAGLLRFWMRRLLRIYPAHLAIIAALLALLGAAAALGVAPRDPGRFGTRALIENLLLLHGWGVSEGWSWNYPSWSISTEWAGYLAFPLLAGACRRIPSSLLPWTLTALLFAVAAVQYRSPVGLNLTYEGALARFAPEFVAGIVMLRLAREGALPSGSRAIGLALGCVAASVAALSDAAVVASLALLIASLVGGSDRTRALDRVPGLAVLGVLSYAFYMSFALSETLLASAFRAAQATPIDRPIVYAVALTSLTGVIAVGVHRFVERPASRLLGPRIDRIGGGPFAPALAQDPPRL